MLVMLVWGSHCHFWCLFAASAPHHLMPCWAASRAAWPSQASQTTEIPSWRLCGWRRRLRVHIRKPKGTRLCLTHACRLARPRFAAHN